MRDLFGLGIDTDWEELSFLPRSSASRQLVIQTIKSWPGSWTGPTLFALDEAYSVRFMQCERGAVLTFDDEIRFLLTPGEIRLYVARSRSHSEASHLLLGPVMSYYLEAQGLIVLHGSAVRFGGQTVAFLGRSGVGKSTLAAACVSAGHDFAADDLVVLERTPEGVLLRPGPPRMRLHRQVRDLCFGEPGDKVVEPPIGKENARVNPQHVCVHAAALSCLYLVEPGTDLTSVESAGLEPRERVIGLLRHSFAARLLAAIGREADRLGAVADVARRVPLRSLRVPRSLDRLPEIVGVLSAWHAS